jgi:hypothetical protein
MQISSTSSAAMQMPSMQGSAGSSTGSNACSVGSSPSGQGQGASPLNDMIQTGKELSAALMMSVLFGKDKKEDDDKSQDPMALMLMAAGASQGNGYDATGAVASGSSVGQNVNMTA